MKVTKHKNVDGYSLSRVTIHSLFVNKALTVNKVFKLYVKEYKEAGEYAYYTYQIL